MPAHNPMFQFGGQVTGTQNAPHSGFIQTPSPAVSGQSEVGANIGLIDATPMRVATIIVLVVLGLAGLRWAGFRFNVTAGG